MFFELFLPENISEIDRNIKAEHNQCQTHEIFRFADVADAVAQGQSFLIALFDRFSMAIGSMGLVRDDFAIDPVKDSHGKDSKKADQ